MQTYMQSDDLLTVVPFEYVPGIYVRSIYVFYVPPHGGPPARACVGSTHTPDILNKKKRETLFLLYQINYRRKNK